MPGSKPFLLACILLLSAGNSWAQSRPPEPLPASSTQKELTVRVTLPTVVGVIGEYAGILSSREKGKLKTLATPSKARTSNPVLILTIPLPKIWADRKPK
ncbi:hypothetical protein [Hymenobacter sublimis]|uniref:Uncharacterized protein n=1 Tax=Hymenobacter sublimis TaxID=2933777 RepID=A0ABY4JB29_9BACT|nr:hypothetical protein [Hymenobacter sublimis]UPL49815.1 hypothetical protein MWH26_02610 [Hymenobacter sublimis]